MKITDRLVTMVIVFLLNYTLSSCTGNTSRVTTVEKDSISKNNNSVRGSFSDQRVLYMDSDQINSFTKNYPELGNYDEEILEFYSNRKFSYAWYGQSGLIEQSGNLYSHLTNLSLDGIQSPAPYLQTLDSLLNDPVATKDPNPQLDILLSAEYIFYAHKVWNGISQKRTDSLQWFIPRKKLNLPYIIDSVLKNSDAQMFSAGYSIGQYNLLKKALNFYSHLDSGSSWSSIPAGRKSYKTGDSASVIPQIRQRLFLLGDIHQDSGSEEYDTVLLSGVRSFQERMGMVTDGIISPGFIQRINTPPAVYARKIIINMERMRWIPTNISKHFLLINIPAFSLYAYDNDSVSFRMNVVVGKDVHKTVLFSGNIQYIVFSPYWNVPPSIMKSEVLPAIKRDPNYLTRNNMEWNGNGIRQKPGPKNSLGLVKFLFPNSYNIYLHDSPAKSLFNQSSRAFSHGCIRLEEPEKLAVYLLLNDPKWPAAKIRQAMHAGIEKYVTIKQPVPVYIGYFTAYVDNRGRVNFRDDVYNRDPALVDMMIK
jgi:L,D-transpeptidase YcbB